MIKRKLRSRRGFTLIEAVVTTLIMSLVGLAITAGTQGAISAYNDSLFVSEGDMLVNNLEIALGDVLRFASHTRTTTETNTVYFSNEDYSVSDGCLFLENGILYLLTTDRGEASADKQKQLINRSSYSNLRITNFSMTYDPAAMVFEGAYTLRDKVDSTLEREVQFCFRTLRPATIPVATS